MNIIKSYQSPNYNERKDHIKYIVLHYTELKSDYEAIKILCDNKTKVSAHYLVSQNGDNIFALVDENKRAWHAGISFWRNNTDLNSQSIGIEISYYADVKQGVFPEFNKKQIQSTIKLCKILQNKYQIPKINILAHSDIAPTRKIDPGELFPWEELAKHGLGVFPNEFNTKGRVDNGNCLEKYLKIIGYSSENITKSVRAFQRRYFVNDLRQNQISQKSILFAKYLAELTAKEK